jgi:hypothetical protein
MRRTKMGEYIKKSNVLNKEFEAEINTYDGEYDGVSYVILASDVYRMPAEDVAPVVHGQWVYDHWCEFKCSVCGEYSNSKPYKGKENYCPNCGAKMDRGN